MRRSMGNVCLVAGFVLAVVGAAVAANAQSVIAKPILVRHTATGFASTMGEACDRALDALNEECPLHGTVSYDEGRCLSTPTPFGTVTICDCEASTLLCLRPPTL